MTPRLFQPVQADAPLTVRAVVSLYLDHAADVHCIKTVQDRRYVLRYFVESFGDCQALSVRPFDLRAWMLTRREWRSNWTKRRIIGTVKAVFGWATEMGLLAANPFARLSHPAGERGQPIDAAEFQSMLRVTSAVFRRVLIFLHYTGARPGEMATAEWSHFDDRRAVLTLPQHKTARRTGRPRRIVLHPVALNLIRWIRRTRPHGRYIFVNAKNGRWTPTAICWRIKQIRKAAAEALPADVTLYACRHAFCTQAVLSGVDIATVAELAGHRRITTTEYYLHVAGNTDHLRASIDRVFRKP